MVTLLQKKTRLWVKGVPLLTPSKIVEPKGPYIAAGTSRKDRSKYGESRKGGASVSRSKTFPGIANAMATQWGQL